MTRLIRQINFPADLRKFKRGYTAFFSTVGIAKEEE